MVVLVFAEAHTGFQKADLPLLLSSTSYDEMSKPMQLLPFAELCLYVLMVS